MDRKIQSGNKILLHPQLRHVKGMADVLRVHEQVDLPIHRYSHFSSHDIVFGVLVVGLVETEIVSVGLADEAGMKRAKFSVGTRVTEIKSKLPGLDLDWHSVGSRRDKILSGPRLHAKNPQREDFCAHQNHSSNYQTFGPTANSLNGGVGPYLGELPDENSQDDLRRQKRESGLHHSFRHLLIDKGAMGRDVLWRHPSVPDNGDRRGNRNHDDGHCKQFRHVTLALPASYQSFLCLNS